MTACVFSPEFFAVRSELLVNFKKTSMCGEKLNLDLYIYDDIYICIWIFVAYCSQVNVICLNVFCKNVSLKVPKCSRFIHSPGSFPVSQFIMESFSARYCCGLRNIPALEKSRFWTEISETPGRRLMVKRVRSSFSNVQGDVKLILGWISFLGWKTSVAQINSWGGEGIRKCIWTQGGTVGINFTTFNSFSELMWFFVVFLIGTQRVFLLSHLCFQKFVRAYLL